MKYLKLFEASHPYPDTLLCIKKSKQKYKFTDGKSYKVYNATTARWFAPYGVYDEFMLRPDDDENGTQYKLVHAYLEHSTGVNSFKYYYMGSDDGGALFTTETLEEYKKRTAQERFDL